EREAKLWDWLLGTEQLDLIINQIDLNPNQMFIGGRAYTII
ncbi:6896_t:CDS:1, partial [Paraglomus brasilianum]